MTLDATTNLKRPANEWTSDETLPDVELPAPILSDDELAAMAVARVINDAVRLDIESVARVTRELHRLVNNRVLQYAADRDEHLLAARDYAESMAKLNGILMGVES